MSRPATASSFRSPAWLLRGISTVPGELRLAGRQLSFWATDRGSAWDWQLRKLDPHARTVDFSRRLGTGGPTLLFSERLEDLRVHAPWYYFRGGLVVTTPKTAYKLSFGRPARSSGMLGLHQAADELRTASNMRTIGQEWLRRLTRDRDQG